MGHGGPSKITEFRIPIAVYKHVLSLLVHFRILVDIEYNVHYLTNSLPYFEVSVQNAFAVQVL